MTAVACTTMTMFFKIRTHRRTALAMLLLWALVIASGFANACLLEQPGAHLHTAATAHGEPLDRTLKAVDHSQLEHLRTAGPHALNGAPNTPGDVCLKVCDDSARSLPKQYVSSLIDLGLPVAVAPAWAACATTALKPCQPNDAQVVVSGLPLRVRFARLAL